MNELTRTCHIDASSLHPAHYFQTLLAQAHAAGIVSGGALAQIQQQCYTLLTQLTQEYARGHSSSVRMETAQNLLESMSYTIGLALKQAKDTDTAADMLTAQPIFDLFDRGQAVVKQVICESKQLLRHLQAGRIKTSNHAYNATIDNGIALFFDAYGAKYAAHETPGSIDYPLFCEIPHLVGVEYIRAYLTRLTLENAFCRRFADIDDRLRGHHEDFENLLINIFEIVLTGAVGCVLCGNNPDGDITHTGRRYLAHKLSPMTKKQRRAALREATVQICRGMHITHPTLYSYICSAAISLLPRLKTALQTNCLDTFFTSRKKPVPPHTVFQDRPKMDDECFRQITEEIRRCPTAKGKATIIQSEVGSFADLTDVLGASCIWPGEFAEIFGSLDNETLALLLGVVKQATDDMHLTEAQKDWHCALRQYHASLSNEHKVRINAIANDIRSSKAV